MMNIDRGRIREAAKFLDHKVPDWYKKINIAELSMSSWQSCILGQLYGSYTDGMRILGLPGGALSTAFGEGNEAWKEEIGERLLSTEQLVTFIVYDNNVVLATRDDEEAATWDRIMSALELDFTINKMEVK